MTQKKKESTAKAATRKCFNCRKEIKGNDFLCKECNIKDVKVTSGNIVIFDKI